MGGPSKRESQRESKGPAGRSRVDKAVLMRRRMWLMIESAKAVNPKTSARQMPDCRRY